MIYYKIKLVKDDGTPGICTLATFDKEKDANARAQELALPGGPTCVVKVTEQHLGTFRSKENATN